MIMISPYIAHHDVDKGVLYEGEEDEEGAGRHEHVNRLVETSFLIFIFHIFYLHARSLAKSKNIRSEFLKYWEDRR